jgi:hypothetical protein
MPGAGFLFGMSAVYEAGRAVVAACFGLTVEAVSVNLPPDLGGNTEVAPSRSGAFSLWMERNAVFAVAGDEAMLEAVGRTAVRDYLLVKSIGAGDGEELRRMASLMMRGGGDARDFVEWSHARASDLVSNNLGHIVVLSAAILRSHRVSGSELDRLLKGPFDASPSRARESYTPVNWHLPSMRRK